MRVNLVESISLEVDLKEMLNGAWDNSSRFDEKTFLTVLVDFVIEKTDRGNFQHQAFHDGDEVKEFAIDQFGLVKAE